MSMYTYNVWDDDDTPVSHKPSRYNGTNPRSLGKSLRQMGRSPRQLGLSPRDLGISPNQIAHLPDWVKMKMGDEIRDVVSQYHDNF